MLPRLWAFALRLTGDKHDAEDLVQRACVRALERSHQLRSDKAPLSWMFSIIHTTWISEVRARKVRHRSRVDWDESFEETIADPLSRDPQSEALHAEIIRTIQRLPESQRTVMLLVAVEGLSYQEAADVLQVPIGTIMSRLWRARQVIGAHFQKDERGQRAPT
ncbi:RNA polymerase sigma factor [Paraburkholderia sp. NMBU_R16]|uniref:RNA polymerase sigma factor n=1 Tax=Paraburkholderia sp. NMBU_R16 TaxID=2698676 RepID=UPI0020B7EB3F|nr:RNA polymerase sigma factor [Paraburkholderia sp. NMBU_R16]